MQKRAFFLIIKVGAVQKPTKQGIDPLKGLYRLVREKERTLVGDVLSLFVYIYKDNYNEGFENAQEKSVPFFWHTPGDVFMDFI